MKICDTCSTIFKDNVFSTYCESYNNCPLRECSGHIIEIDENIYEVYRILNEKGYVTRNCCSAHSFSEHPQTYIQFYGDLSFPSLPDGFELKHDSIENEGEITTISKNYNKKLSSVELQMDIWDTSKDLLKWAESLKCVDNCPPTVNYF